MSDVTQALILAAGRGTRLGALTADCPKPLLDLEGKPILERIVTALRDGAGVTDFVLVTGHLREQIEAHFGDGSDFRVRVRCIDQGKPQGTGQAVHIAREAMGSDPFVMTYGDIVITPSNYGGIVRAFREHPCDLLIGLNWVEDPWAGGAVYVDDDGNVTRLIEKPPRGTSTTHWNSAGLMVMSPVIFEHTAHLQPSPRGEYEIMDAMTSLMAAGGEVRGYPLEGFWSDVGTPEDLERTRAHFRASQSS